LGWSAHAAPAPLPIGTILVLGDSLTAGYELSVEQRWSTLLDARLSSEGLPWRVVNAGVSGDTTAGGLTRLPELLETHHPVLVILALGANDGLRGMPPAQIEARLRALIEAIQASGAEILLAGQKIPPNLGRRYTEAFEGLYPKLAQAYHLPSIPFLLEGAAGDPALTLPDGMHPNARGQEVVVETVYRALVRAFKAP